MERISEKEFLEQVAKHQNIIHKVCNMFCRDEDDKRDLFQEITIKLWLGHESFAGQAALTTWMYRVALNTAITIKRKKKKLQDTQTLHPNIPAYDDESDGVTQFEIDALYGAINQLQSVDRAIILLYLEEKSYEEIAEIMGITRTHVGVKITRIKKKLEKHLKHIQE
jgi:RNA polymerase sigma-70 factor (ECF subfamily)